MTDFLPVLTALQRYPNPVDIFAETLRPELVEEALSFTRAASIRGRKLPAEQVYWAMVALALDGNRSIRNVFDTFGLQVNGKVQSSV